MMCLMDCMMEGFCFCMTRLKTDRLRLMRSTVDEASMISGMLVRYALGRNMKNKNS
jgi:hypothetical protein